MDNQLVESHTSRLSHAERLCRWRRKHKGRPATSSDQAKIEGLVELLSDYGLTLSEAHRKLDKTIHMMSSAEAMANNIHGLAEIVQKHYKLPDEQAKMQTSGNPKLFSGTVALEIARSSPQIFQTSPGRIEKNLYQLERDLVNLGLDQGTIIGMSRYNGGILLADPQTLINRLETVLKWRRKFGGEDKDYIVGLKRYPSIWDRSAETIIDRTQQAIPFYLAGHCYLKDKFWGSQKSENDLSPFMKFSGQTPGSVLVAYEFIALRHLYLKCPYYTDLNTSQLHPANILNVTQTKMKSDLEQQLGDGYADAVQKTLSQLAADAPPPVEKSIYPMQSQRALMKSKRALAGLLHFKPPEQYIEGLH